MSDEENKVVDDSDLIKDGKHPESVPWNRYVGVKEILKKKEEKFQSTETEFQGKVSSLEEQLKNAVTKEEHEKIKGELEETKTAAQKATDDLNTFKEGSLKEKREALVTRGISEEKVKDMSSKELDAVAEALGKVKPAPDLGGGGGSGTLQGNPTELARQAYAGANK